MEQNEKTLPQIIVTALIQFFYMLAFILILCPFKFWTKAAMRLEHARTNSTWDFIKSNSRWPFLSFLKAIIFGFIFDGTIFISYFVGVIAAFASIGDGFDVFLLTLVKAYYAPLIISPLRDLLYIGNPALLQVPQLVCTSCPVPPD